MTMQERRSSPRHGVRIEGKLMSADMTFCVDVIIRNLSENGAMIVALAPAETVPESVYLWQARTRTLLECTVQWRRNDRLIGLNFTAGCSRSSVQKLLEAATSTTAAALGRSRAPAVEMQRAG